jgi:hypothetical protein
MAVASMRGAASMAVDRWFPWFREGMTSSLVPSIDPVKDKNGTLHAVSAYA